MSGGGSCTPPWATRRTRQRALDAGCHEVLLKPFDIDDLIAIVERLLTRMPPEAQAVRPPAGSHRAVCPWPGLSR